MLNWYTKQTEQLNDAIADFTFRLIFFTDDGRSFTLYTDDAYELLSPNHLWLTGSNDQERVPAVGYTSEDFYDDPVAKISELCMFFVGKAQDSITLFLENSELTLEFDAKNSRIALSSSVETLFECHEQDLIAYPVDCWDEFTDILLGSG